MSEEDSGPEAPSEDAPVPAAASSGGAAEGGSDSEGGDASSEGAAESSAASAEGKSAVEDSADSGGGEGGAPGAPGAGEAPPGGRAHPPIDIEKEMASSYVDYAMSVIVARALPDSRDGLKPVQRRILHAMKVGGYDWNRPFRKSASVVGDVISRWHPHGNDAIYDAMARMAQDFTLRVPLVDGQGNFGSMDDDPPAAMRYTEARLQRVASEGLLEDIDRDTVDFQPNYDESSSEPTVLPARFPNLLVNGAAGIAVGMATSIPPHNLGEVVAACRALAAARKSGGSVSDDELARLVPGPDFPTGGVLLGRRRLAAVYASGQGTVPCRARVERETLRGGVEAIVMTEPPPGVGKKRLLDAVAEAVRSKTLDGISDIRDESSRAGVRVVIEVRRGVSPDLVLNRLWRQTPMQSSVSVLMLAIRGGRPETLTLRDALEDFLAFREEVVARRTAWRLARARERAHLLVGLAVAVSHIDEVVALIRAAAGPAEARVALTERLWPVGDARAIIDLVADPRQVVAEDGRYRLSDAQAQAILELRLQRLTGLERGRVAEELRGLAAEIEDALAILRSRDRVLDIIDAELAEVETRFATPRRTLLSDEEVGRQDEDLIRREEVVVTLTRGGYAKRVPIAAYRSQRRGGRGRSGMATRDDDFVSTAFVVDSHAHVLFISSRGTAFRLKGWRLPEGAPQSRGKALVNLLPLEADESIAAMLPMPADEALWERTFVVFATGDGRVRRNRLSDFARVPASGKRAMRLEEGARLVGVMTCDEGDDVFLATARGMCIRFPLADARVFQSRASMGVRGVRLREGDEVIALGAMRSMEAAPEERQAFLAEMRARARAEGGANGASGRDDGPGAAPEDDGGPGDGAAPGDGGGPGDDAAPDDGAAAPLSPARLAEMEAAHQTLLTLFENGLGRLTSSYEYRVQARGGFGNRNGPRGGARVVAVFPIEPCDDVMAVSDRGQMIRTPARHFRITGRASQGVRVFRMGEGESLASAARLSDPVDPGEGDEGAAEGAGVAAADGVEGAAGVEGIDGAGGADGDEAAGSAAAALAAAEAADDDLDPEFGAGDDGEDDGDGADDDGDDDADEDDGGDDGDEDGPDEDGADDEDDDGAPPQGVF